jgi:hypothetical protein
MGWRRSKLLEWGEKDNFEKSGLFEGEENNSPRLAL